MSPPTTKTEDRIQKILEDHTQKELDRLNEKVSGIFLYGVVIGVIASYSGFLGYGLGVCSGIVLAGKYKHITTQVSTTMIRYFDTIVSTVTK
jgi:transketolase N-terminal domain/subunit